MPALLCYEICISDSSPVSSSSQSQSSGSPQGNDSLFTYLPSSPSQGDFILLNNRWYQIVKVREFTQIDSSGKAHSLGGKLLVEFYDASTREWKPWAAAMADEYTPPLAELTPPSIRSPHPNADKKVQPIVIVMGHEGPVLHQYRKTGGLIPQVGQLLTITTAGQRDCAYRVTSVTWPINEESKQPVIHVAVRPNGNHYIPLPGNQATSSSAFDASMRTPPKSPSRRTTPFPGMGSPQARITPGASAMLSPPRTPRVASASGLPPLPPRQLFSGAPQVNNWMDGSSSTLYEIPQLGLDPVYTDALGPEYSTLAELGLTPITPPAQVREGSPNPQEATPALPQKLITLLLAAFYRSELTPQVSRSLMDQYYEYLQHLQALINKIFATQSGSARAASSASALPPIISNSQPGALPRPSAHRGFGTNSRT